MVDQALQGLEVLGVHPADMIGHDRQDVGVVVLAPDHDETDADHAEFAQR